MVWTLPGLGPNFLFRFILAGCDREANERFAMLSIVLLYQLIEIDRCTRYNEGPEKMHQEFSKYEKIDFMTTQINAQQ